MESGKCTLTVVGIQVEAWVHPFNGWHIGSSSSPLWGDLEQRVLQWLDHRYDFHGHRRMLT